MTRTIFLFHSFGLLLLAGQLASSQNPTNTPDIRILMADTTQSNVSIAVHPIDGNIVMVSFSSTYQAGFGQSQGWFFSTNSGVNWFGSVDFPPGAPNTFGATVLIDASGKAYYVAYSRSGVPLVSTTDFGASWSPPSNADPLNSDFNYVPRAAIDHSRTYPNNVYATWTDFNVPGYPVQFTRSTDQGVTWSQRTTLAIGGHRGQGSSIACGPDGEVCIAWAHYTTGPAEAGIGVATSTDGGATFSTPAVAFAIEGIRVSTGYNPEFNSTHTYSYPSIDVDRSNGPRRGWIYIAYADRSQGQSNVYVRKSSDEGASWSDTLRVNGPHIDSTKQAWLPSLAVDAENGDITVTYFQFDLLGNNFMTNRYAAHSSDGGDSWQRWVISDVRSLWSTYQCGNFNGCTGRILGTAALGGKAWAIWSDKRTGWFQIWLERIEYKTTGIHEHQELLPVVFTLFQNYPNPFNPTTTIRYSLPSPSSTNAKGRAGVGSLVTLNVYDVLGREVATLVNEVKQPGRYQVTWDATGLPSGVYFYRLSTTQATITKKMLLLR